MIVFYGVRSYGKAAQIDDEYALTRWFHVYFVPLVPIGSMWIRTAHSETSIGLHGRSVGLVYARVAALICGAVGLGMLGSSHALAGIVLVAVAAALAWLSMRWRHASARERKRAGFHRAIYSLACPPESLPHDKRTRLRAQLDEQWAAVGGGRTPEDVARLGARNGAEAAAAYMILTLAGAHADADRIVDGAVEPSELGGPFRGVAMAPGGAADPPRPAKISLNAPAPIPARTGPAPVTKAERRATGALVAAGIGAATIAGIVLVHKGATMSAAAARYGGDLGPTGTIVVGVVFLAVGPSYLVWRWFVRGRSAWKQ